MSSSRHTTVDGVRYLRLCLGTFRRRKWSEWWTCRCRGRPSFVSADYGGVTGSRCWEESERQGLAAASPARKNTGKSDGDYWQTLERPRCSGCTREIQPVSADRGPVTVVDSACSTSGQSYRESRGCQEASVRVLVLLQQVRRTAEQRNLCCEGLMAAGKPSLAPSARPDSED